MPVLATVYENEIQINITDIVMSLELSHKKMKKVFAKPKMITKKIVILVLKIKINFRTNFENEKQLIMKIL